MSLSGTQVKGQQRSIIPSIFLEYKHLTVNSVYNEAVYTAFVRSSCAGVCGVLIPVIPERLNEPLITDNEWRVVKDVDSVCVCARERELSMTDLKWRTCIRFVYSCH